MAIIATIQHRRGNEADLDKSKLVPAEVAVTMDTEKVIVGFGSGKSKELASREDVQTLIDNFGNVVDAEIEYATNAIREEGERVLATIPDDFEEVAAKADEAVRTKSDAIILTNTGEHITNPMTAHDPLRGLKMYGKGEQRKTTGAQLANFQDRENTLNGVTTTFKDGVCISKGTPTINTGYVFTYYSKNVDLSLLTIGVEYYARESVVRYLKNGEVKYEGSFVYDETVTDVQLYVQRSLSNYKDGEILYPRLVTRENIDIFEPYTGGLPSPSPEYPQEIETCGKVGNLFSGFVKGVGINASTGAEIKNNSGAASDYIEVDFTKNNMFISGLTDKLRSFVAAYDKEKTFVTRTNAHERAEMLLNKPAFAQNSNFDLNDIKYIRVYQYEALTATGTIDDIDNLKVQLEYGNTPTSYRPYNGGQREIETEVFGKNLFNVFADNINIDKYGITTNKKEHLNVVNDDGSVTVNISGTSTYGQGFTLDLEEGQTVTFSCNVKSFGNGLGMTFRIYDISNNDNYQYARPTSTIGKVTFTFTSKLKSRYLFGWYVSNGTEPCGALIDKLQLELGDDATDFELGKARQSHITTVPNGLPGIEVTDASLANYVDEDGKMWCADEIDYERGVYVKRIMNVEFDGYETGWYQNANIASIFGIGSNECPKIEKFIVSNITKAGGFCSHFAKADYTDAEQMKNNTYDTFRGARGYTIRFRCDDIQTLDDFKSKLAESPITVLEQLETPIELPIPSSEIVAYRALHSNYPTTNVSNDCDAGMEVKANADLKMYIDSKIAEISTAILNN